MFARQFDRAHIVGFDFEFVLPRDFTQAFQIGFAFQQHLRRQNNLFAAFRQIFRQADPVGKTHFLAARTHMAV
ncbi:Uncharacterised protein [Mycobacteroides abscessus subsp. massiliense]|nr:Uncharacterised protein [Mycobacteroides abscessus subsp. massiliense]